MSSFGCRSGAYSQSTGKARPTGCRYRHSYHTARVLGRVSASTLDRDGRVEGFALVMALSYDCTNAYERWADPADITEVREVSTKMLEFFARPVLPAVDDPRRKMERGYLDDCYLSDSGL